MTTNNDRKMVAQLLHLHHAIVKFGGGDVVDAHGKVLDLKKIRDRVCLKNQSVPAGALPADLPAADLPMWQDTCSPAFAASMDKINLKDVMTQFTATQILDCSGKDSCKIKNLVLLDETLKL